MSPTVSQTATRITTSASGTTSSKRAATQARRPQPMPRSTTRVIWTMSQGTLVEFGDIA